jgi:hypothetical protein
VKAVVDGFEAMRQDLEAEKNAMTRVWKKREGQFTRMTGSLLGVVGDLQGIGEDSLPQLHNIAALPLPFEDDPVFDPLTVAGSGGWPPDKGAVSRRRAGGFPDFGIRLPQNPLETARLARYRQKGGDCTTQHAKSIGNATPAVGIAKSKPLTPTQLSTHLACAHNPPLARRRRAGTLVVEYMPDPAPALKLSVVRASEVRG